MIKRKFIVIDVTDFTPEQLQDRLNELDREGYAITFKSAKIDWEYGNGKNGIIALELDDKKLFNLNLYQLEYTTQVIGSALSFVRKEPDELLEWHLSSSQTLEDELKLLYSSLELRLKDINRLRN